MKDEASQLNVNWRLKLKKLSKFWSIERPILKSYK